MSLHLHSIAEVPDSMTPRSLGSIGGENTLAALAVSVQDEAEAASAKDATEADIDRHTEAVDSLALQMANIPANTARGIIAKLRAYRLVTCDNPAHSEYPDDKLLASLLLDIDRFFAGA